jgi:hypothetical protein
VDIEEEKCRVENVVERKKEGGCGCVIEPTRQHLVLGQKCTDFHENFYTTHCITTLYTIIQLYICEFQPRNDSRACTVTDEAPLPGEYISEAFLCISYIVR